MYAEALVKNIMGTLFPTDKSNNSDFDMSFGFDFSDPNWWNKVPGLAEGGSISTDGAITGPGTGTSDSILARVSNGERIVDAATVRKWGHNFFERLKSGDIHNLQIPIPEFASGGAVGNVGADAAARGMAAFSQDLGVNVSPNLQVNAYVDGQRIFDKYGKDLIKIETRKEILNNLKMYNQLGKRFK